MEQQELINLIVAALDQKGIISISHKMQNGKAVQIKTKDGSYFNIATVKLMKGEGHIVQKLR
jgi:hypothetical protein